MHNTAMVFIETVLSCHPVQGRTVLEVGSYNVNGSVRDWVEGQGPVSYLGVDLQPQPRYVDETLSACDLIQRFGRDAFDVVICAELLEHAEDWRAVVRNLKGVLKVGGLLVLTCRGPGFPRHDFPSDYWRFTVDDMQNIFSDSQIMALIADSEPGILLAARKTELPEADISSTDVAAVR
jgi:SAM-dependent methyltransferase